MRHAPALLLLTAIVAAVLPAGAARAQDATRPAETMPLYMGPPNLYAATAPEPDLMAELGLYPTGPDLKPYHPICNWIKQSKCYCVTHHNIPGCGSFKSECVFIFGSCRQFYGEPCFKGPNPYPHKWSDKGAGCPGCGQW